MSNLTSKGLGAVATTLGREFESAGDGVVCDTFDVELEPQPTSKSATNAKLNSRNTTDISVLIKTIIRVPSKNTPILRYQERTRNIFIK
ncbi:MAG: hypothetical protein ABL952_14660, partial [Pyrinomonadaceae bacterium]